MALPLLPDCSSVAHVHTKKSQYAFKVCEVLLHSNRHPSKNSFQQHSSLLDFAGFHRASLKSMAEIGMAYPAADFAFDDWQRRRLLLQTPLWTPAGTHGSLITFYSWLESEKKEHTHTQAWKRLVARYVIQLRGGVSPLLCLYIYISIYINIYVYICLAPNVLSLLLTLHTLHSDYCERAKLVIIQWVRTGNWIKDVCLSQCASMWGLSVWWDFLPMAKETQLPK